MLTTTTHQLTPHPAPGQKPPAFDSLFLRELVNYLVRQSWDELEQEQLNPAHFFNRDIKTGVTQIGYPLVIYHFIDGRFYVTGINSGAKAVEFIATKYKAPFEYKKVLYSGFKPYKCEEFSDVHTNKKYCYALQNWIPVHHRENAGFNKLNIIGKAQRMEAQLSKHIKQEFCKYLSLRTENVITEITDITHKPAKPIKYKGYNFWTYHIGFTCNLHLPEMLCLGNNKALGFGRIIKQE